MEKSSPDKYYTCEQDVGWWILWESTLFQNIGGRGRGIEHAGKNVLNRSRLQNVAVCGRIQLEYGQDEK